MAQRDRHNTPGSWHHEMNRGIARRALFEDKNDIRYLWSRLAQEVRCGMLEVHAWCLMTTHDHLLGAKLRGAALARDAARAERPFDRTALFRIAMCRVIACVGWSEIAARVEMTDAACARVFARHNARLMAESDAYVAAAGEVASRAMQQMLS